MSTAALPDQGCFRADGLCGVPPHSTARTRQQIRHRE
jgi:hypothetical protein